MPDFLPSRDAELVTWSTNFNTRVSAAPTTYGLTAGQATAYDALHDAFVAAYNTASADATNSTANVIAKDDARANLKANARTLARIVQANPSVTNVQRSELGLTVRDAEPSPIPPPAAAPGLDVVSVSGNTVRVRLHDTLNPARRGRPDGVAGAAVFSYVGATAPSEAAGWTFEGNTVKTTVNVMFPAATAPGAKVWFTAFWFNAKAQSGPACAAVGTNLPGGAAMAA
jgi:hypothetical protein